MVALHAGGVEPARGAELRVDVDDEPAPRVRRLLHEEERELARELDQPVVPRFGHDEHGVDVRVHARAACGGQTRLVSGRGCG